MLFLCFLLLNCIFRHDYFVLGGYIPSTVADPYCGQNTGTLCTDGAVCNANGCLMDPVAAQSVWIPTLNETWEASNSTHRIAKLSFKTRIYTTAAGVRATSGLVQGSTTAVRFKNPAGISLTIYYGMFLYVADTGNNNIRQMPFATLIFALAIGSATAGNVVNVAGASALVSAPRRLVSYRGLVFICDSGNRALKRMVGTTKFTTTVVTMTSPLGVMAVDYYRGTLYAVMGDHAVYTINMISGATAVSIGVAATAGDVSGTFTATRFFLPQSVEIDTPRKTLYVLETFRHIIKRVQFATSATSLWAGAAPCAVGTFCTGSYTSTRTTPTSVALNSPTDILIYNDTAFIRNTNRVTLIGLTAQLPINQVGAYVMTLTSSETKSNYTIFASLLRIRGCTTNVNSTTMCPSTATFVIEGNNLPPVAMMTITFGQLRCGTVTAVTTASWPTTDFRSTYNYYSCTGITGTMPTSSAPLEVNAANVQIGQAYYLISSRISISYEIITITSLSCGGLISECPTIANSTSLTIVGNMFEDAPGFVQVLVNGVKQDDVVINATAVNVKVSLMKSDTSHSVTVTRGVITSNTVTFNVAFRPVVSSVKGCTDVGTATAQCETSSILTVIGSFLTTKSAVVSVGGINCGSSTVISATTVTCVNAFTGGTGGAVQVLQGTEYSFIISSVTASLRQPCATNGNGLCGGHGTCSNSVCSCLQSSTQGYWRTDANGLCAVCSLGYYGSSCLQLCTCVAGECNPANGLCTTCNAGFAGSTCTIACPTSNSVVCGGHGTCNDGIAGSGVCTCFAGYAPPDCSTCDSSRYGPSCSSICPTDANQQICSGRGTCDSGITGTGVCLCNAGFSGTLCSQQCPVANNLPCGGHGTCTNGACVCDSSSTSGFWALDNKGSCTVCAVAYNNSMSASCLMQCPGLTQTSVCSGVGWCSEGVCTCPDQYCSRDCSQTGSACQSSVCSLPYLYGLDCSKFCDGWVPGTSTSCSGHGTCNNGRSGTGHCVCNTDSTGIIYVGSKCDVSCKSCGTGVPCTEKGVCLCPTGTAGVNCKSCPGTPSCSNHGLCVALANNIDVQCVCTSGYVGADCSATCPDSLGGVTNPCSGHGKCSPTTCTCNNELKTGFWQGSQCSECVPPYLPPNCNQTCPGTDLVTKSQCHGHGVCRAGSATCECFQDNSGGFWQAELVGKEFSCVTCSFGYWGSKCLNECPGGACSPCNGHGKCFPGNGTCGCVDRFVGAACQTCVDGYYGIACNLRCPGQGTCNGHGSCDGGISGSGNCTCFTGYSGSECTVCMRGYQSIGSICSPCPLGTRDLPCSGQGDCIQGQCVCSAFFSGTSCQFDCPLADDGSVCNKVGKCVASLNGAICQCPLRFQGAACQLCASGSYGSNCDQICPGGKATPCNLKGTCSISGTCSCDAGYTGNACQLICPGGLRNPCSGHGVCDGTCTCFANPVQGFWAGDACDRCFNATGVQYRDESTGCRALCPTNNNQVCNGVGVCTALGLCSCPQGKTLSERLCGLSCELSGTACVDVLCPTGRWGSSCEYYCPGYALDSSNNVLVCSGHGSCESSKVSPGVCTCKNDYIGEKCNITCEPCDPLGGVCDKINVNRLGKCVCNTGYGGKQCATACPKDALGTICSGQGYCTENATCVCNTNYIGGTCQFQCRGKDNKPCNNHGVCYDAGGYAACSCNSDAQNGFFTGLDCSSCVSPYEAPFCNSTCPGRIGNATCSGHGVCDTSGLQPICKCIDDPFTGTWDGADCSRCRNGYYGFDCTRTCAGGACLPCSGHGTCDDGITGTGTCTCTTSIQIGMWNGYDCSECISGYYGTECQLQCPGGANNPCFGHGYCVDGPRGTGSCTCDDGYAPPSCDECVYGLYGKQCKTPCPTANGGICGGESRGTCSYGIRGSGKCTCKLGYIGSTCEIHCPVAEGRVCNGKGQCLPVEGLGICNCSQGVETGYWAGSSCSSCAMGFWGRSCDVECPGGASNTCSGNSVASMNCNKDTGICSCLQGFSGEACNVTCPVVHGSTCAGHGSCGSTGTCSCSSQGFWDSTSNCGSCVKGYVGNDCTQACPGTNGVCSGNGVCSLNSLGLAMCTCNVGTCGTACENSGVNCSTQCTTGYVGQYCNITCPQSSSGICSNRGTCVLTEEIAHCMCDQGYTGTSCDVVCSACSSHGTCSTDGTCVCQRSWAGQSCSLQCPGNGNVACGISSDDIRGVCSEGRSGNGTCSCFKGWGGPDCSTPCPGMLFQDDQGFLTNQTCLGRGTCVSQPTPSCMCFPQYNGTSCGTCALGKYGLACNLPCPANRGVSTNSTCYCKCNSTNCYFGESCSNSCPTFNNTVCGGHGTCDFGIEGSGACDCDTDYYGKSCEKRCVVTQECSGMNVNHTICNADGNCECIHSKTVGFWAGSTCDECHPDYYDLTCTTACNCNFHGTCDRSAGICSCYASVAQGYWTDDSCSTCLEGYIGTECNQRSSDISLGGSIISSGEYIQNTPQYSFSRYDALNFRMFSGSRPILVTNTITNALELNGAQIQNLQSVGTAVDLQFVDASVISILVLKDSDKTLKEYRFNRVTLDSIAEENVGAHHRNLLQTDAGVSIPDAIIQRISTPFGVYFLSGADSVFNIFTSSATTGYKLRTLARFPMDTARTMAMTPEGRVLYVGGSFRFLWYLIQVNPTSGTTQQVNVNIPLCVVKNRDVCQELMQLATSTNVIILILSRGDILIIAKVDLNTFQVNNTGIPNSQGTSATALTLDTYSGMGYVSYNADNQPSIVATFDLYSTSLLGSLPLQSINNQNQVVAELFLDSARRLLHVTTATTQLMVLEANAYVVTAVEPDMVSQQGGGVLTVHGRGFSQIVGEKPLCIFTSRDGRTVRAPIWKIEPDGTKMYCTVPSDQSVLTLNISTASSEVTGSCDGFPVEVSLHSGDRTTENGVLLRRVNVPILQSITPTTGTIEDKNQTITVYGSGFLQTPRMACQFRDMWTGVMKLSSGANVTLVNSQMVLCKRPQFEQPTFMLTTFLAVTLDGFSYSYGLPFNVTSKPVGLSITEQSTNTTYRNQSRDVVLPPIAVHLVDVRGHVVDDLNSRFNISVAVNSSSVDLKQNVYKLGGLEYNYTLPSSIHTPINGTAMFTQLTLLNALAGSLWLRFTEVSRGWSTYFKIEILPGPPYAVKFVPGSLPNTTTGNYGEYLKPNPRLRIVDVGGNYLLTPQGSSATLDVVGFDNVTDTPPRWNKVQTLTILPDSSLEFTQVIVIGKFSHRYRFVGYGTLQTGESLFPDESQQPLTVAACQGDGSLFQIPHETTCTPCDKNGICNGVTLIPKENYWRFNTLSKDLYLCHEDQVLCLGKTETGQCRNGHTGPRCRNCEDGWGKYQDLCERCEDEVTSGFKLFGLGVLFVAVSLFLVRQALHTAGDHDVPFVLGRQMINHVQLISQIGHLDTPLPSLIRTMYKALSSITSPDPSFPAADCVRTHTLLSRFAAYMGIPLLIPFIGGIYLICSYFWHRNDHLKRGDSGDENFRGAQLSRIRQVIHARRMSKMSRKNSDASVQPERKASLNSISGGLVKDVSLNDFHMVESTIFSPQNIQSQLQSAQSAHFCPEATVSPEVSFSSPARPNRRGSLALDFLRPTALRTKASPTTTREFEHPSSARQSRRGTLQPNEVPEGLKALPDVSPIQGDPASPSSETFHSPSLRATMSAQQHNNDAQAASAVHSPAGHRSQTASPMMPVSIQQDQPLQSAASHRALNEPHTNEPFLDTFSHDPSIGLFLPESSFQDFASPLTSASGRRARRATFVDHEDHGSQQSSKQKRESGNEKGSSDSSSNVNNQAKKQKKTKKKKLVDLVSIDELQRSDMRSPYARFFAIFVVLFNIIFITLMRQCAVVLNCIELQETVYEETKYVEKSHKYLAADYRVRCNGDEYWRYATAALFFTCFYAVVMPCVIVTCHQYLERRLGKKNVHDMFLFMVTGYRDEYKFWEFVIMIRKSVLVYVTAFTTDIVMQTYISMWWISLNLGLQYIVQPFRPTFNNGNVSNKLETVSLALIAVHLNMSLLYVYNTDTQTPWYFTGLSIVLFALVIVVFVYYVRHIVTEGHAKLLSLYDTTQEGRLGWKDFAIILAIKTNGRLPFLPLPEIPTTEEEEVGEEEDMMEEEDAAEETPRQEQGGVSSPKETGTTN